MVSLHPACLYSVIVPIVGFEGLNTGIEVTDVGERCFHGLFPRVLVEGGPGQETLVCEATANVLVVKDVEWASSGDVGCAAVDREPHGLVHGGDP